MITLSRPVHPSLGLARRLARCAACRAGAVFAATLLVPALAAAATIYTIDARLAREGAESLSPTFIVTPGERALLAFDERDLEVAVTLLGGGAGATGPLELRVEMIEGVELVERTVPISLAETTSVRIADRELTVLVREQPPLAEAAESEAAPADAEADEGVAARAAESDGEADASDEER